MDPMGSNPNDTLPKGAINKTEENNMNRIMLIALIAIMMIASPISGAVVTQDVEIRGEIAVDDIKYDYTNFGAFWYDLDKNHSSETMNVTTTGVTRTIAEGALVYTCTPQMVKYKNSDLNATYGKYKIIGFMAEKYIGYDNRTDQLVKLLINWGSSTKMILTMDDPMELPAGYMLSAQEIDLQGDRVWLKLYKDGNEIDNAIVEGGKTYTYEDDNDVLLFSCKIDSVFRGTESNMVVVKFVFMRSDTILDIDGGDSFGVMEVKSTASTGIILKNDEVVTLDSDSEQDIMDSLYFKVADDSTNLRYYLAKTVSLTCPDSECPTVDPCPPCNETEPCPEVTPEIVIEYVNVTVTPADKSNDNSGKNTTPGFEAVFAIAGLFVVGYLVLKQRK